MVINIKKNYKPFLYNCNKQEILKELYKPLFTNFGVTCGVFQRFEYSTGKGVFLSTHLKASEFYLSYIEKNTPFFPVNLQKSPIDKPFYFCWPESLESNFSKVLAGHKIGNCFTIYFKKKDCLDFFLFSGHPESHSFQRNCLNNSETFECFAFYFKDRLRTIIQEASQEASAQYFSQKELYYQHNTNPVTFHDLYKLRKAPIYFKGKRFEITAREAQCLNLRAHGEKYKDIARQLLISPRTVEAYIENIKTKIGVTNNSELRDIVKSKENILLRKI